MRRQKRFRIISLLALLALLCSSLPVYAQGEEPPPPAYDPDIVKRTAEAARDPEPGPSSLSFTLKLPEVSSSEVGGYDVFDLEGFSLDGVPGEPALPRRVYNFALPPDVKVKSLTMEVLDLQTEKLPGTYDIQPLEVMSTMKGVDLLGESYQVEEPEAHSYVRMLPPGQMRKWKFARVEFTPFDYDPATGEITAATEVKVQIDYEQKTTAVNAALLADSVMDDAAMELFENYQTAKDWYLAQPSGGPSKIVVITTNAIEAGSSKLSAYLSHKNDKSYNTMVITEDEYGGLTGQSPNGTAEKIRKWLQDNYISEGITHVLLIGDPDPDDPSLSDSVGDVPMKMVWPRRDAVVYTSYKESATDYFYADLSGDWDKDSDDYYGEWNGDYNGVTGGVDLTAELYVGRIPQYDTNYSTLDDILQKIIDYETEFDIDWRESILLPESFSDEFTDGAALSEQMIDDYLNSIGYSNWTLYQQGTACTDANSSWPSDEELHGSTTVRDRWNAGDYGAVLWWGHGSSTSASIGYSGCSGGTLMNTTYAATLDDDKPSFVYQCSCTNGRPETTNNLGYELLKNGAIATYSAARVSWYYVGQAYGTFDGSQSNSGIGFDLMERLLDLNYSAGSALYNTKGALAPAASEEMLMNFYDFNLYGDPTTRITSSEPPPVVLNELDIGAADRVELYNYGSTAIDLTGWEFTAIYSGSSDTWTIPSFTLPAGGYVTLDERSGTDTSDHIYFNDSIILTAGFDDAIQLVDDGGNGVDFMRWGTNTESPPSGTNWYSPNPPAPTNSGPQLARYPNGFDTDYGRDWCLQDRSFNVTNPGCSSGDRIGMYEPAAKTWYLKQSNNDGWSNVSTVRFGSTDSSWIPVEGDWNGDGTDTIGMYSRTQKTWYLKGSNTDGWADVTTVRFGSTDTSWVPVVGDWNGNGTDTIGIFEPATKSWYLKGSNTDGWGDVTTYRFGSTNTDWVPVVGDWFKFGRDYMGMYEPAAKSWYLKYAFSDGWGSVATVRFGSTDTSWVPVVGDWNGWDYDRIGMYEQAAKTWYLKTANLNGWDNLWTIRFGSTDTSWSPEAGDW